MLPDTLPPGLMDALQGGGQDEEEPDSIDIGGGGQGEELSPADHLQAAIEHAQAALHAEPDSADSAKLAKLVQGLYAVQADQEDAHMETMGGNPKQMRTLRKAYGARGAVGGGNGSSPGRSDGSPGAGPGDGSSDGGGVADGTGGL